MENQENNKNFFIKHQAETAGEAAKEILKVLGKTDDLFLLSDKQEDMEKNDKAYQNLLQEVLKIFTKHKVGLTNYPFVWSSLKSIIGGLEQHMGNHTKSLQTEINSRAVGTKNPLTGKYDIDHATHEDLIQATLRLRESQGNVPGAEDYFTIVKPQEEGIVSPIQLEKPNE